MVLAVFIVIGSAKKDFNPLIECLEEFALTKEQSDSLLIDPSDFVPKDRAYYSYEGSHTSPPCVEGVRWLVFRGLFSLSSADVERLRRVVGENSRPVQALNGRVVEASF
jgi:carbonic anhydrase